MRRTDPQSPIVLDRTTDELEECLLFCIVVAGKTATTQQRLLKTFLSYPSKSSSPFTLIREMNTAGVLSQQLMLSKLGQYTRLTTCFRDLVNKSFDLRTCTVNDLESIHGIGPKTARFFLTCTRENVRFGVIDTHLLKFMRDYLHEQNIPATTPGNRKEYSRLENIYLDYADSIGANPAKLDLAIWKMYSNKDNSDFESLLQNPQKFLAVHN
jgi:thermostable 8-oxoguanine DNA glycosylase